MYNPAKTTSLLPLLLLLAGTACAPSDGGQVGEENFGCVAAFTEELAVDDSTPLGFSVAEVLTLAQGTHQSPLVWADDSSTVLRVTMSYASRATYQDREWRSTDATNGGAEPDLGSADCLDILNIEMNVQLMTDDGALNESFSVDLQAALVTEAAFYSSLDPLIGSLAVEGFAPAGSFSSYSAALDLVIDADGIAGTISGLAETAASGDSDDGAVSATQYPIASFGQ